MKNKAVEAMIRLQHNITDDICVKVEFSHSKSLSHYSFTCIWWKEEVRHEQIIDIESSIYIDDYSNS